MFKFVPAPFFPFPAACVAAQIRTRQAGDEEPRVTQSAMAADLPVIEVLDILPVEENSEVTIEPPPEIRFQFAMKSRNESCDGLKRRIVTLMGVGDEKVVGHSVEFRLCSIVTHPGAWR